MKSKQAAFSLVEVVVATGIFALAVVSVLGVMSATSKSISETKEADSAFRLIGRLTSALQHEYSQNGYSNFKNAITSGRILYANKDASKVGLNNSQIRNVDGNLDDMWKNFGEKYFRIDFIPNNQFPLTPDTVADARGFISFFVRVAYPAYLPNDTKIYGDDATTPIAASATPDDPEHPPAQVTTMILPVTIIR